MTTTSIRALYAPGHNLQPLAPDSGGFLSAPKAFLFDLWTVFKKWLYKNFHRMYLGEEEVRVGDYLPFDHFDSLKGHQNF
jgi:hypothetical protein